MTESSGMSKSSVKWQGAGIGLAVGTLTGYLIGKNAYHNR